jgi:hypothetical protein
MMRQLESAGLPPPPPAAVALLLVDYEGPAEVLGIVIRAAHAAKRGAGYGEFMEQAREVVRWASDEKPRLDKLQKRTGWPWLVRQAQAWRQRALERQGPKTWPSALAELRHASYRVVPLDTIELMVEESLAMKNCLIECVEHCQTGAERYFSVRDYDSGKRRAVIQLVLDRETRRWTLGQVKGPCNGEVCELIENLAWRLADRYERRDRGPREIADPQWLTQLSEAVTAMGR